MGAETVNIVTGGSGIGVKKRHAEESKSNGPNSQLDNITAALQTAGILLEK